MYKRQVLDSRAAPCCMTPKVGSWRCVAQALSARTDRPRIVRRIVYFRGRIRSALAVGWVRRASNTQDELIPVQVSELNLT